MIERENSAAWPETALRYLDALDAADAAALAEMWEQAAGNPQLEQVLGELTDGLADEEDLDHAWRADAESIRGLLRQHLPSGFRDEDELPPLTVRDVASRLQADNALGARFSAADRAANSRLLADATPLPEQLGLPHFEKWQTTLGVGASAPYWRAFRQAAVLMAMGRCQQAGELAAAPRRRVSEGRTVMSQTNDGALVADAIQRLFADANQPWPPPPRRTVVPVPLDTLIRTYNLDHKEVPGLTRAAAGASLLPWGIHRPELLQDASPLAGFLFANAKGGYILVNADDPLPRRRFTAAHELGHYLLHFLPRLQANRDVETYLVQDDSGDTVREEDKPGTDKALSLPAMERQANRFAAELLMPESVCRTACEQYAARFRTTPRFLERYLARDLLVSREAVRWRLRDLSLT